MDDCFCSDEQERQHQECPTDDGQGNDAAGGEQQRGYELGKHVRPMGFSPCVGTDLGRRSAGRRPDWLISYKMPTIGQT